MYLSAGTKVVLIRKYLNAGLSNRSISTAKEIIYNSIKPELSFYQFALVNFRKSHTIKMLF